MVIYKFTSYTDTLSLNWTVRTVDMVIRRLVHLLGAGVFTVTTVLRRVNTFDGGANNSEFNWA